MADQEEDGGAAAAPTRDDPAGNAPPPSPRARSVWAEMVVTGAGDGDPEPPPQGHPPGIPGGESRWPASGLPPMFGRHSTDVPAPGPEDPGTGEPRPASPGANDLALARSQGHSLGDEAAGEPGPAPPAATAQPADSPGPGPAASAGPSPGHAGLRLLGPGALVPDPPAAQRQEPRWQQPGNADSLTADFLLPGRHTPPGSGWRRVLYQASGGRVRAPQSAAQRQREELIARASTPVAGGHHRVAVLSLKGGVGKTTTTVGLGATLASLRGDRVIAVDANPDRGTLCDKVRLETAATVRDLLNERDHIQRYADVRGYTTQAPSRLEVLASDRDPTVSVAFSAWDYEDVARVLEHYYSICVTDCGTGLLYSAMAGVLRLADQVVLVSSPSVDGARSASATLDWLVAHNYGDLVRSAVVVLSAVRPRGGGTVDLGRLEQHFAARCRSVVRVPFDAHLAEGAEVDLRRLSRATSDGYLALAAEIGDGFARPRHHPPRPA